MKKTSKLSLVLLVCISLWGCSSNVKYETIDAKKAKEMMENEVVIILDVRTSNEFNEGHIENAINIDSSQIEKAVDLFEKDQTILVYCRSGNRSKKAAKQLAKLGYTNVFDFGGINNWSYGIIK